MYRNMTDHQAIARKKLVEKRTSILPLYYEYFGGEPEFAPTRYDRFIRPVTLQDAFVGGYMLERLQQWLFEQGRKPEAMEVEGFRLWLLTYFATP